MLPPASGLKYRFRKWLVYVGLLQIAMSLMGRDEKEPAIKAVERGV
jgi:hypothetical protein